MTGSRLGASAVLVAMLGLSACTYFSDDLERIADQSERIFHEGQAGYEFRWVDLSEVLAHAPSYKHMAVKFNAYLNRRNETLFAPFFMNMKADDQMNFSVWPEEAELWTEKGRMGYVPTLYIRKDNKTLQTLLDAPAFSLFQIRGTVESEFEGYPIIFVRDVELIEPGLYTAEGLTALGSATTALEQKRPAVAIEKLEQALDGVWTRSGRIRIHMQLANLYFERGDFAKSIEHYEGVLENDPDNAEALKGIERAEEGMARRAAAAAGN